MALYSDSERLRRHAEYHALNTGICDYYLDNKSLDQRCRLCGKVFRFIQLNRANKSYWGYGKRGARKGIDNARKNRHFEKHAREVARVVAFAFGGHAAWTHAQFKSADADLYQ